MKQDNILYILSNGRVAAISKKDGSISWEIKLKQYGLSNLSHSVGQITVEDNKLYVGCAGVLVCLDTKDGSLIWKNNLKGWGFGFVSMANVNNDAAGTAIKAVAATGAAVAATGAATAS
jgi:outer membrane protein assembly factor BamB